MKNSDNNKKNNGSRFKHAYLLLVLLLLFLLILFSSDWEEKNQSQLVLQTEQAKPIQTAFTPVAFTEHFLQEITKNNVNANEKTKNQTNNIPYPTVKQPITPVQGIKTLTTNIPSKETNVTIEQPKEDGKIIEGDNNNIKNENNNQNNIGENTNGNGTNEDKDKGEGNKEEDKNPPIIVDPNPPIVDPDPPVIDPDPPVDPPVVDPTPTFPGEKGKQLCIFYGWATYVNGAGGDVAKAVSAYQNCDQIVLGDGLQETTHDDHDNTKLLIEALQKDTKKRDIYGYVNIGVTSTNTPIADIHTKIDQWNDMGITGMFVDEAGYDYGVTRQRQLDVMNYIHDKNLQVFANAWDLRDVLSPKDENKNDAPLPLRKDDRVLIEHLFAQNSKFDPTTFDRINDIRTLTKEQSIYVSGVATTKKINECKVGTALSQYLFVASYLFGIDSYQCSDYFYGSSSARMLFNEPIALDMSPTMTWLDEYPTLENALWTRKNKEFIYNISNHDFTFSKVEQTNEI